jgi:glycosyltransferase involved in cell wall biosynthesis
MHNNNTKKNEPLVSVLMTVYNREAFLAEAIESVLQSSYKNLELIIVDDCSSDKSLEIAYLYAKKDTRISVYVNEKNLTDYPNRHRAAMYANGKYLKYMDSDDILYPFGLEIMVNRMEQNPEAGLGLSKWSLPDQPFPVLLSPKDCYEWSFLKNRYVFTNAPSSSIILREAYFNCGGFSGLNQIGDCEFWMKLASKYYVVLMEGGTNWARDHATSEKYKDSEKVKAEMVYQVNKKALLSADCPLNKEQTEKALKILEDNFRKNKIKRRLKHIVNRVRF